MMRGASRLRAIAAMAALAGLQIGGAPPQLDPGQNARAESRGQNTPGSPVQLLQQSALDRLLMGGGAGGRMRINYIRRPLGSVARDKRAARKRRNVLRSKRR